MSLDKKAILKDIEVLIRSIKVHYDNIENEHRIPTIELELITSKIRKLHEKSIVYNHLHYMEEDHIQSSKRIKMDQLILNHSSNIPVVEAIDIENRALDAISSETKVEEKPKIAEEEVHEVIAALAPQNINEVVVKEIALVEGTSFEALKLSNKIGINDRFRFIKQLFGANGNAMEEAIIEIENCNTPQALADCISKLKKTNNWNEEDETVIDFLQLLK